MRASTSAIGLALLVTVAVSCGSGQGTQPAVVSGKQTKPSPPSLQLTPIQRRALAERYLAIANPANKRLDAAVDALHDHRSHDLSAAAADLKEEASVERGFDRQLLGIDFPAQIQTIAIKLVGANEARADLAIEASTSGTLSTLAALTSAQSASDARVEIQVNIIRHQLGLPPADQG